MKRHCRTGPDILLLVFIYRDAQHIMPEGRGDPEYRTALEYAFILDLTGLKR